MTTPVNVNAPVVALNPYKPGKPIEELARERGIEAAVKLGSNENPCGPGPGVRDALAAAMRDLSRYPDGSGFRLKNALAEHLDVQPQQITLGNGSNDVLDLAARVAISPGTRGVVDEHCFVVYPLAIKAAGGELVRVASQDWGSDLDALADAIDADARIVYIANPNNPTGTWVDRSRLCAFLERVPQRVWIVLDEAYAEYVLHREYPNGIALVERYPNLIVTRTFSKIHGLAALRIGYAVSSPAFADLMNRVRQPFNANALALAAAEAALTETQFVVASREINAVGMAQIENGLQALGLEWIPSAGNFVTFHVGAGRDAADIYEALLDAGVIVRPIANYGMPRHLRVTIGLPAENIRFLEALAKTVQAHDSPSDAPSQWSTRAAIR